MPSYKPQLASTCCLLLSVLLSPVSPQHPNSLTTQQINSHLLLKRQLPNQTGSTSLPIPLLDPTGANRSLDPTKTNTTPTPTNPSADPAGGALPSPSPSPSPSPNTPPKDPNSLPKDPSLTDPLLPGLLGSPAPNPATPSPSPTPPATPSIPNRPPSPNNPPSANSTNPASSSPSSTTSPAASPPLSPTRAQLPTPDPTSPTQASSSPSPSADSQTNRTPKTQPHKSDDSSSGFGSTTIKLMAIIAGSIAGLFLLWTVIRKWKFRPSKRFAKKLDEYDEDVFAPRPPSFGEKRANDYQTYSIPPPPNTAGTTFGSQYPSYLPERSPSPHSIFSPQKLPYSNDPNGSQAYQAHRLSHVSITQPPAMFEPNPYRLSLGLGNNPHAYPPSDQHKPTAL